MLQHLAMTQPCMPPGRYLQPSEVKLSLNGLPAPACACLQHSSNFDAKRVQCLRQQQEAVAALLAGGAAPLVAGTAVFPPGELQAAMS